MKKLFGAIFTALALGVGAYFSPELAWNVVLGIAIVLAAIVISWAATSLFKSWHGLTAMISAFIASMLLGYKAWGWGDSLLYWGMASLIPMALAPKLYERLFRTDNATRAVLAVIAAKCGVRVRWNAEGDLSDIKVGTDDTIFVGSPTIPDIKREGVKPEPSNE